MKRFDFCKRSPRAANSEQAQAGDGSKLAATDYIFQVGSDGKIMKAAPDNITNAELAWRHDSGAPPPLPVVPATPVPATVVMVQVEASTRRIRWLFMSAMYRLPAPFSHTPIGLLSIADVAVGAIMGWRNRSVPERRPPAAK